MATRSKMLPVLALLLGSPAVGQSAPSADAALDSLADWMVANRIEYAPTSAYAIGVAPPDHRRWADRSPAAIAMQQDREARLLAELERIDRRHLSPRKHILHAAMAERLEANTKLRICRSELWDVNHMSGWHLALSNVAKEQPVGTEAERRQALERWSALPRMIDQEIANARAGLAAGYSAARPVVAKVIKQVDGLIVASVQTSPLSSPAERSEDAAFQTQFRTLVAGDIRVALTGYRDFLQQEYLPRAREALGVSANPDGSACYRASLRSYTTLGRSPQQVFDLGSKTVAANMATVVALGEKKFGTRDLARIAPSIAVAEDNQFASEAELIAFSRDAVTRAREKATPLFAAMPVQEVRAEPFLAYQRGSGRSAHYEAHPDPAKPAYYRINSENWASATRGGAEITAVHEAYPGHHMQIAFANMLDAPPVTKITRNSAYSEGWARYSEMLAEEAGMYQTDYALMTRRLWPARGMVVDPGIHVFDWTRDQATAFLRESGRFGGEDANDMIDRIAALPGQLTAYDSGGLEIMALRREAEKALGARFDLRVFHQKVLEHGAVPLGTLRANIEVWIAAEQQKT